MRLFEEATRDFFFRLFTLDASFVYCFLCSLSILCFRRQNTQNAVEQFFFKLIFATARKLPFLYGFCGSVTFRKIVFWNRFIFVSVWLCVFSCYVCFLHFSCFGTFSFPCLSKFFISQANACPRHPRVALSLTGSSLVWLSSISFPFFFLFLLFFIFYHPPGDTAQAPKRDTLLPPKKQRFYFVSFR